jgi:hypothetical protein
VTEMAHPVVPSGVHTPMIDRVVTAAEFGYTLQEQYPGLGVQVDLQPDGVTLCVVLVGEHMDAEMILAQCGATHIEERVALAEETGYGRYYIHSRTPLGFRLYILLRRWLGRSEP